KLTQKKKKNELKIEHLQEPKTLKPSYLVKNQNSKKIKEIVERLLAKLKTIDSSLAENWLQFFNNCDCDIETIQPIIDYLDNFIHLKSIYLVKNQNSKKINKLEIERLLAKLKTFD
ncbi:2835_t:CDS:1, partial [Dentiscutata erythropus]